MIILAIQIAQVVTTDHTKSQILSFVLEYIFEESTFSESIVTKYQLVCQKDHLGPLITAAGHFGIGIASLAGGYFGDRFGRINSMFFVSGWS